MAPIRIVHLGLGAFHRAHQACYTERVDPDREWGIAAFTGRAPDTARTLTAQDGLYTLIERSDAGDTFSVVASIVEAVDGADLSRLAELVAAPTTALITLTVTEAAYRVRDGALDLDADIVTDLDAMRFQEPATLTTIPARLTFALAARRAAAAGPLALVPCDNLADNAGVLRIALTGFAELVDPGLARWIEEQVSFVGTCVDRITPATTPADVAAVARECTYLDDAPVVTEPFHEWVLSGDFPAGRPAWERAGARFVADVRPYETRKLWLLNGAHSLLAYLGQLRGLATVADAITDPVCRTAVQALWDSAQGVLDDDALDLTAYRRDLLLRFENRSIEHQLAQIAVDGSVKLRQRVVPVALAAADPGPALMVLAAWMDYLAALPEVTSRHDAAAGAINAAFALNPVEQTRALLHLLEPGADDDLCSAVHALRHEPIPRSMP